MEYFNQRIRNLSLTPAEAKRYGLYPDEIGNIRQYIYLPNGNPVKYYPNVQIPAGSIAGQKRETKKLSGRKTFSEGNSKEQFSNEYYLTRLHPDAISDGGGKYKYLSKKKTGISIPPFFYRNSIEAYRSKTTGGTCVITEGAFKAICLDKNGVKAIGFGGIQLFQFHQNLQDYLKATLPDNLILLYDADALDISKKQKSAEIDTKRLFDFYRSAERFYNQFKEFCYRYSITNIKLHFCMVNPDQPKKGVDDLYEFNPGKEKEITENLLSLTTSKYFIFRKLSKKTGEKQLKDFFKIESIPELFARYDIDKRPLKVGSGVYCSNDTTNRDLFSMHDGRWIEQTNDPFKVDYAPEGLKIDRYLHERYEDIDSTIEQHQKITIQAPTGSGKTTFFLGGKKTKGYFTRTRQKGVLLLPYRANVEQIKAMSLPNVTAVYGFIGLDDTNRILNSQLVVTTYDNAANIPDIDERVIVIDESHDLVSQYGFRAEAIKRIHDSIKKARKTILISATPNLLYGKIEGYHYLKIDQRRTPSIWVKPVNSFQKTNESLISEIAKITRLWTRSANEVHFIYWNNGNCLEAVKTLLIERNGYKETDIELITRTELDNSGELMAYSEIIKKESVLSKKVILSTCLISEGVNINNTNIGDVVTVDVRSPEKFVQYVSRFRKMDSLNITNLSKPARPITGSMEAPEYFIDYHLQLANVQLNVAQTTLDKIINEYGENYFLHQNDISENMESRLDNDTFNFLLIDYNEHTVSIDMQKMYKMEFDRQEKYIDSIYMNSVLHRTYGYYIENIPLLPAPEAEAAAARTIEVMKKTKADQEKAVKQFIIDSAPVVFAAYWMKLQDAKNHITRSLFKSIADVYKDVTSYDAQHFINQNEWIFSSKNFRQIIRAAAQLYSLGLNKNEVSKFIQTDYTYSSFSKSIRIIKIGLITRIYEKPPFREYLHLFDRQQVKLYKKIRQLVEKEQTGSIHLQRFRDKLISEMRLKTSEQVATLTESKVLELMSDLYKIKRTRVSTNKTVLSIQGTYGDDILYPIIGKLPEEKECIQLINKISPKK